MEKHYTAQESKISVGFTWGSYFVHVPNPVQGKILLLGHPEDFLDGGDAVKHLLRTVPAQRNHAFFHGHTFDCVGIGGL